LSAKNKQNMDSEPQKNTVKIVSNKEITLNNESVPIECKNPNITDD